MEFINKIFNDDCLNVMAQMPNDYCNLTITSPPYNFNAGSGLCTKYNNSFKDNLTPTQYLLWSIKVIKECMRISKLVCWNIQMIAGNKEALLKYLGYFHKELREIIIWDKKYSEPAMSPKVLNSEFEFILLFDKNGGGRKIEQAEFNRGTVSNIIRQNKSNNSIKSNNDQENHFAVFPDIIPAKLMHYYSTEGDVIFDPFVGSGTTCLQTIKYNRRYVGCELIKEYYDIAQKRIDNAHSQLKLF